MSDTKFQLWLMDNQPKDEMLWKEAFWHTYVFWRDRIIPMFNPNKRQGYKEWEQYHISDIDAFTDVVGSHYSKSILNPVLKIQYKGVNIVFRYNFYDYEIAVISDGMPLIFPVPGLFQSKTASFFYQGFPEQYILDDRYEDNKFRFMASLGDHYQFYTFMTILKYTIDESHKALEVKHEET